MEKNLNVILFDDQFREELLPFTFTRPVSSVRVGITTIREKWELQTGSTCSVHTADYLEGKYPSLISDDNFFINGSVIPDDRVMNAIMKLQTGELLLHTDIIVAYRSRKPLDLSSGAWEKSFRIIHLEGEIISLRNTWDIFRLNDRILRDDFSKLTSGRRSEQLSSTNQVLGAENIFIEEGVRCECSVINAETGPVYLGKGSEVMEGCMIRGPFALCDHAVLKMGAKIYGATTIGPECRVGGEVNNSVFTGYSNKAHDGFLGNSVIGEWCNLGADSNNSNLKNTYAEVKLWSYTKGRFVNTGLQFCGLIMGDHSKCGINTMFNTGTVVGVSANIFGAGFPRNFIPSFTWGGAGGTTVYKPEMALETAGIVMSRRDIELTEEDVKIFRKVFELTKQYRKRDVV